MLLKSVEIMNKLPMQIECLCVSERCPDPFCTSQTLSTLNATSLESVEVATNFWSDNLRNGIGNA